MKPIAARISKLLQTFKDHVMKKNKEWLVPKLMSNAQLTSKCVESNKKEITEQVEFFKFHENIAAGEHDIHSGCNCSEASTSRKNLKKQSKT